jgi:hypothetical protein
MDYIQKVMPYMAAELVGLIYGYIDMETRLSLLLTDYRTEIIPYLYRVRPELLLAIWLRSIQDKIYIDHEMQHITPAFENILHVTVYSHNNTKHTIQHPIYDVISSTVKLSSYRTVWGSSQQRNMYLVEKIDTFLTTIPAIYTYNHEFDYKIRKLLFRFVQLLMKPIRAVKVCDAAIQSARVERLHRNRFKRVILPKLLTAVRKMERTRIARCKLEVKEEKKRANLLKKEVTEEKKRANLLKKKIKEENVKRAKLQEKHHECD